jgi:hypothetical protein
MMEVGKKYVGKATGCLYKCLAVYKDQAWVTLDNSEPFTVNIGGRDFTDRFREYKEPVVHTRYIHWYKDRRQDVFAVMGSKNVHPDRSENGYIKTDIVTYTEDQ